MPVLTAQQEKDYCKHDYLRYESIWIPGGTPINQANRVEISGRWVTIGDAGLGLLLRLVVELKRCKGGWVKIGDLVDEGVINAGGKYQALNRLRKAFQRGLPEGVAKQLIQRSGSKEYRLSTHPSFATYSRAKLVEHPDKTVRAQARKLPRSRRPKR